MRNLLKKYPTLSHYLFALTLFGLALVLSGLINKGVVKAYFPYTSAILLGIATWVLYKTENKSLKEIGLNFSFKNLLFFLQNKSALPRIAAFGVFTISNRGIYFLFLMLFFLDVLFFLNTFCKHYFCSI